MTAASQSRRPNRSAADRGALSRRGLLSASGAGLIALGLAACGGGDDGLEESGGVTTIRIAATEKPHAEILRFVQDHLASAAKLKLDIQVQTDYQVPDRLLDQKEVDANYFQHVPFLEEQISKKGYHLTHFDPIHIEPLGAYSKSISALDQLKEGDRVAIPNDPTNRGRALALLADNGVITIAKGVEPTAATPDDVDQNPKKLTFSQVDAALIPRTLKDFALGVINGNYAIEAGLTPSKDALALEKGEGNPYANVLAVRTADKGQAALKKLDELLHSDDVRSFITSTYKDGSVLPAF